MIIRAASDFWRSLFVQRIRWLYTYRGLPLFITFRLFICHKWLLIMYISHISLTAYWHLIYLSAASLFLKKTWNWKKTSPPHFTIPNPLCLLAIPRGRCFLNRSPNTSLNRSLFWCSIFNRQSIAESKLSLDTEIMKEGGVKWGVEWPVRQTPPSLKPL